jgi:beta-lactamase regulating signal transducer with metallopeptidase domain
MPAIGLALISNTLFAAAMCVAAEIIRRMRRPALAHAIWALALLKLVTPPLWHVHFAAPAPEFRATSQTFEPIETAILPPARRPAAMPHVASPVIAAVPHPVTSSPVKWSTGQILLTIWCAGSLALLAMMLIRLTRFRFALRTTEAADKFLTAEIGEVARQLVVSRAVRVGLADDVCPMIWFIGLGPVMVLPRSILSMGTQQRRAILAHELAHLRRGDHWVRLLELFATIALWWHPLVWLARYRLREAEEEACDAWVMWAMPQAGKTYAQTLVDMVRVISGGVPAAASRLGGFGQLQRRLIMILEKSPRKSVGLTGWLIVAALSASLPLSVARGSGTTKVAATQPLATSAPSDETSSAIKALLQVTTDKDPQIQNAASRSIFSFGDKAIPILVEGMRDPATSGMAKILLTNFGPKAVDPLIAELHAKDRSERLNALQALGSILSPPMGGGGLFGPGVPMGRGGPEEAGPGVPGRFGSAAEPQNDLHLERIESAVAELTRDPDTEIRQHAAAMLGSLAPFAKDDSALDRMITLLEDEDKQVREFAAQSLGMQGPKAAKAVDALTKVTTDKEPIVRVAAVTALGAIGPGAKNATAAVTKALKDYEPQVRLAAASALGRMNTGE